MLQTYCIQKFQKLQFWPEEWSPIVDCALSPLVSYMLFRRKGENAQQVIDLSAALKVSDKDLVEKQSKIDSLEAELISLTDDLKRGLNGRT